MGRLAIWNTWSWISTSAQEALDCTLELLILGVLLRPETTHLHVVRVDGVLGFIDTVEGR